MRVFVGGMAILISASAVGCVNVAVPTATPAAPTAPPPTQVATLPATPRPTQAPTVAPTAAPTPTARPSATATPLPPSFDDQILAAQRVGYADLEANGIDYVTKTLYFKGRVLWSVPAGGQTSWIGVEVNEQGDLLFVGHTGVEAFAEGDWIELVAPYSGLHTYETVDGEAVTVPSFQTVSDAEVRGALTAGFDVPSLACTDRAHKVFGERWNKTYRWSFQDESTPADLDADAVLPVLQSAIGNITGARNDCGLEDKVGAEESYEGVTERKPDINGKGKCTSSGDDRNVIGFRTLPEHLLGVTCARTLGNVLVEADIAINADVAWALSLEQCRVEELLEATMTHEFGHAFGLGHVKESKHGVLTMSTNSNGPCHAEEITLGLGDVLGLEKLY